MNTQRKPLYSRRWLAVVATVASLIGVGTSAGTGHRVTLHLLESKTGKPIKNASASLVTWRDGKIEVVSQGKTNRGGSATFILQDPLPDRIGFDFSPDELKYCSDLAFSTTEILDVGVIAKNKCGTVVADRSGTQKGQITLFVDKVSLNERMRRELP